MIFVSVIHILLHVLVQHCSCFRCKDAFWKYEYKYAECLKLTLQFVRSKTINSVTVIWLWIGISEFHSDLDVFHIKGTVIWRKEFFSLCFSRTQEVFILFHMPTKNYFLFFPSKRFDFLVLFDLVMLDGKTSML